MNRENARPDLGPDLTKAPPPTLASASVHSTMKNTLKYVAILASFISAGFAFSGDGTIAGVLAVGAGILIAVTVPKGDPK